MSQTNLIQKIQRGDRRAFSDFYDRYHALVYSIALRILRKPEDANDLLQEVFVYVWQKAPQYSRQKGTIEAWLITLTRSRAIDLIRSFRRGDKKIDKVQEDSVQKGSAVSEVSKQERVTQMTLQWGLDKLVSAEKEVMELSYFDGV